MWQRIAEQGKQGGRECKVQPHHCSHAPFCIPILPGHFFVALTAKINAQSSKMIGILRSAAELTSLSRS